MTDQPLPIDTERGAQARAEEPPLNLAATVSALHADVEHLKKQMDKPSKLSIVATFLGILAVILAVLKFPAEIADLYSKPDTTIASEHETTLSFDRQNAVFEARWIVTAANAGKPQDQLDIMNAQIVRPGHPDDTLLTFDSTGFKNVNAASTTPLLTTIMLPQNQPGSYLCILRSTANNNIIDTLATGSTRRCLRVLLQLRERTQTLSGCFDLAAVDAEQLKNGDQLEVRFDTTATANGREGSS